MVLTFLPACFLSFVCILPVFVLGCPKECVCRGTHVKCPAATDFPKSFPVNTEKIDFDEITVVELPPKAFHNLPNLTTLSFSRCNFGQISACAFPSNHKKLRTIVFDLTVIGEIKQGAFTRLSPVSITFRKSTITTLRSYAFWNINTQLQLTFTETTVHVVEAFGFNNVTSDLSLKFEKGRLKHTKSAAFYNTVFSSVNLQQIVFDTLECKAFPRIDEAKSLIISACRFQCNCDIAYMTNIYNNFPSLKLFVESSMCEGPEGLKNASVKDVLDNNKIQNCPASKQFPSTCQPVQEIPEHVCPNKIVMGEGESNGSGSNSQTNTKAGNGAATRGKFLWIVLIISCAMLS